MHALIPKTEIQDTAQYINRTFLSQENEKTKNYSLVGSHRASGKLNDVLPVWMAPIQASERIYNKISSALTCKPRSLDVFVTSVMEDRNSRDSGQLCHALFERKGHTKMG